MAFLNEEQATKDRHVRKGREEIGINRSSHDSITIENNAFEQRAVRLSTADAASEAASVSAEARESAGSTCCSASRRAAKIRRSELFS